MNLITCEKCGVVLNKDVLVFQDIIHSDDFSVNLDIAVWDGQDYVSTTPCPVCGNKILEVNQPEKR